MTHSLLKLKHHSRRKFSKHFLAEVELGLFFDSEARLDWITPLEAIASQLQAEGFQQNNFLYSFDFMVAGGKIIREAEISEEPNGVEFRDQATSLQLTRNGLVWKTSGYTGFEAFVEQVQSLLQQLSAFVTWPEVKLIKWRKKNAIKAEVNEYRELFVLFHPGLFGLLRSELLSEASFSDFKEELNFQQPPRSGTLETQLQKLDLQHYGLALDFTLEEKTQSPWPECLQTLLPALNDLHFDWFMWATTEEFRRIME